MQIGAEIFDPSYGLRDPSLDAFRRAMLWGYALWTPARLDESVVHADLNGDGDNADRQVPVNAFAISRPLHPNAVALTTLPE